MPGVQSHHLRNVLPAGSGGARLAASLKGALFPYSLVYNIAFSEYLFAREASRGVDRAHRESRQSTRFAKLKLLLYHRIPWFCGLTWV